MRHVLNMAIPDTLDELFALGPTAALVIDVQNDFADPEGIFARSGSDLTMILDRLPRIYALISGLRLLGVPLIHVHQQTLPGGASDGAAWVRLKTRTGRSSEYTLIGSWGAEPLVGFEPMSGERVVRKFRPDAFLHTELELLLRSAGVQSVIVCGMFTEGCVESTVRTASYLDFHVAVVDDAIASAVPDLHANSLHLMRSRYFTASTERILDALAAIVHAQPSPQP